MPSLMYPRMHQLCATANDCSPMLALLEVMLSADDLRALAPGIESRLPNLSSWASKYSARQPISVVAAGDRFTGFDGAGVVYITRHRPTEWLVTSAAAARK